MLLPLRGKSSVQGSVFRVQGRHLSSKPSPEKSMGCDLRALKGITVDSMSSSLLS
jgi:hypothetical protein